MSRLRLLHRSFVVAAVGALAVATALIATAPGGAATTPSAPDPSFGTNGRITNTGPGGGAYRAYDVVATMPDGRQVYGAAIDLDGSFFVERRLADGTLDLSFSGDGRTIFDASSIGVDGRTLLETIHLAADGGMTIVGHSAIGSTDNAVGVATRLLADGSLDPTYNGGDVVVIEPPDLMYSKGSAVDALGRAYIVVNEEGSACRIARLDAGGSLDPTFGTAGIQTLSITGGNEYCAHLRVDDDGRPLVLVYDNVESWNLVRLLADGSVDPTFGTLGTVEIAPLDGGTVSSVANLLGLDDGSIVVALVRLTNPGANSRAAVVRYSSDGNLDAGFGTGGWTDVGVATNGGGSQVMVEAPGSRVVAATELGLIYALTAAGDLDPAFGTGGSFSIAADVAYALAVDSSGRIVAAGGNNDDSVFIVRRFEGWEPPPPSTTTSPTTAPPTTPAPPAPAPTPTSPGYWMVAQDGGVFSFGDAPFFGSTGNLALNQPIVGAAPTPSGGGYWFVAADGGVFSFGDADFFGSAGDLALNQPIVAMIPTTSGNGYWLLARDGGVFSYGDAPFFGSTGNLALNQPIIGGAATPSGNGYWFVAADGGIFAFGDAKFYGSTGDITLNQPIVAMVATPSGNGYWFVARDGGVFNFGDAQFFGSASDLGLTHPVVSMTGSLSAKGYRIVSDDGAVYTYGDAAYDGGLAGVPLAQPVIAALPRVVR